MLDQLIDRSNEDDIASVDHDGAVVKLALQVVNRGLDLLEMFDRFGIHIPDDTPHLGPGKTESCVVVSVS